MKRKKPESPQTAIRRLRKEKADYKRMYMQVSHAETALQKEIGSLMADFNLMRTQRDSLAGEVLILRELERVVREWACECDPRCEACKLLLQVEAHRK